MADRVGKNLDFLKNIVKNKTLSRKRILKLASVEELLTILECISNISLFLLDKKETRELSFLLPILNYVKKFKRSNKGSSKLNIKKLKVLFIEHHNIVCKTIGIVLAKLLIESFISICHV